MSMDEIIPRLWVGDLPSALDTAELKRKGIFSILTAMRGKVQIHETFIKHQIQLDDDEESDILTHFLPCIAFIQAELDKGRAVLVHCQAGMSRSVSIVAAYLMYTRKIDPQEACKMIRSKRWFAEPNLSFHRQLQVFHDTAFDVTGNSKEVRRFYMDLKTEQFANGDGGYDSSASKFFATAPPSTMTERGPRRRIRCKMCRHELAAREHMLDHGQVGDTTPPIRSVNQSHGVTPAQNVLSSSSVPDMKQSMDQLKEISAIEGPPKSERQQLEAAGRNMSDSIAGAPESQSEDTPNQQLPTTQISSTELTQRLNSSLDERKDSSSASAEIAPRPIGKTPDELSPPLLKHEECSGYFLEPMKWMDPFLSSGLSAGKINCPNSKCSAKLGNYDWAGLKCGCKQWIVPGFCISRRKVDEIVR